MNLFIAVATSVALLVSATTQAQTVTVTRAGSRPVRPGPAENFTGSARIERLFDAVDPSHAGGGSVTFDPGARTAWHSHPRGQILIVTAGIGRVQGWGGAIDEIRTGDVVRIPAGQKHWHGGSPRASMTHIAISEHQDGTTVRWMEKVTDEQYNAAPRPQPDAPELTNDVVLGDLWRRPDLTARDRSLVTIAALGAMGDEDQLDVYLRRGIASGLTRAQIGEALTHLGFYAGWPRAAKALTAAAKSLGK